MKKKTFEIAADVDITPQKYNAKTQIWNIFTSFLLTPQFHAFLVAFTSLTKNWKKRLSLFYNVTVLLIFFEALLFIIDRVLRHTKHANGLKTIDKNVKIA